MPLSLSYLPADHNVSNPRHHYSRATQEYYWYLLPFVLVSQEEEKVCASRTQLPQQQQQQQGSQIQSSSTAATATTAAAGNNVLTKQRRVHDTNHKSTPPQYSYTKHRAFSQSFFAGEVHTQIPVKQYVVHKRCRSFCIHCFNNSTPRGWSLDVA